MAWDNFFYQTYIDPSAAYNTQPENISKKQVFFAIPQEYSKNKTIRNDVWKKIIIFIGTWNEDCYWRNETTNYANI